MEKTKKQPAKKKSMTKTLAEKNKKNPQNQAPMGSGYLGQAKKAINKRKMLLDSI